MPSLRLFLGIVPGICVTILGCATAVPAVFDRGDSGAELSTSGAANGGFSNPGGGSTGSSGSSNGGFPGSTGGFGNAAGSSGGVPNSGGTAGIGGIGPGGTHGSGGMQSASCANLACFDVFDCAFLYLGNTCGFTQCVAGICK